MDDMERRDGSQLAVAMSDELAYWLDGYAAASEELGSVPDRSMGGKMKEEVVEDVKRVEEGIVDRFGAKRMEGLSLVARSSRWAVAAGDIGRSRVEGRSMMLVGWQTLSDESKKHGLRTHRGVHLEVDRLLVRPSGGIDPWSSRSSPRTWFSKWFSWNESRIIGIRTGVLLC